MSNINPVFFDDLKEALAKLNALLEHAADKGLAVDIETIDITGIGSATPKKMLTVEINAQPAKKVRL